MAQKLEAEDAEQRQRRLRAVQSHVLQGFELTSGLPTENILERLNGDGPTTSESPHLSFDFGDRTTFAMEPPTERTSVY